MRLKTKNKITSFMLQDEIRKKIKHICVEQDISLGEFIRRAIAEKLSSSANKDNRKIQKRQ